MDIYVKITSKIQSFAIPMDDIDDSLNLKKNMYQLVHLKDQRDN